MCLNNVIILTFEKCLFLSVHVLIGAEPGDSGGEADVSSVDAVGGRRGEAEAGRRQQEKSGRARDSNGSPTEL